MKPDIKTIRQAVLTHRGGLQNATDAQILTLWNSLPADVQQQYLADVRPTVKGGPDA